MDDDHRGQRSIIRRGGMRLLPRSRLAAIYRSHSECPHPPGTIEAAAWLTLRQRGGPLTTEMLKKIIARSE